MEAGEYILSLFKSIIETEKNIYLKFYKNHFKAIPPPLGDHSIIDVLVISLSVCFCVLVTCLDICGH